MKTIIFKWNPAFSSYTMIRFLDDLRKATLRDEEGRKSNWSAWDYDKVGSGDRFYLLKVGFGQTGLVAKGRITSKGYREEDWSWNNRPTYYLDYLPEIMINPDAFRILTSEDLQKVIPTFEWHGGHSGLVLADDDAETLEEVWSGYMKAQAEAFDRASDDNLFIARDTEDKTLPYSIDYERDYNDRVIMTITAREPHFEEKTLCKKIEITNVERLKKKLQISSLRVLSERILDMFPMSADLSKFCAMLYDYDINYSLYVYLENKVDEEDDEEDDDE